MRPATDSVVSNELNVGAGTDRQIAAVIKRVDRLTSRIADVGDDSVHLGSPIQGVEIINDDVG